jgi:hypothetical protein
MGSQGVSQCFGCGVVGEGEKDTEDGNFYCFACWLIYHAARARLRRDSAHVQPARNFQDVSCAPGSAQHERSVQNVSLTHFFDSGSAAAVGRQERWTQRLFVWLAKGGRKVENFESNGCARRARKLCGAAHWGGDLRAGEKVRERAGVAGEARARQISRPGDRTAEHTGKRRRRYGRAGVHTENAWGRRVGSA